MKKICLEQGVVELAVSKVLELSNFNSNEIIKHFCNAFVLLIENSELKDLRDIQRLLEKKDLMPLMFGMEVCTVFVHCVEDILKENINNNVEPD